MSEPKKKKVTQTLHNLLSVIRKTSLYQILPFYFAGISFQNT